MIKTQMTKCGICPQIVVRTGLFGHSEDLVMQLANTALTAFYPTLTTNLLACHSTMYLACEGCGKSFTGNSRELRAHSFYCLDVHVNSGTAKKHHIGDCKKTHTIQHESGLDPLSFTHTGKDSLKWSSLTSSGCSKHRGSPSAPPRLLDNLHGLNGFCDENFGLWDLQ